jgi:hypothetical protein
MAIISAPVLLNAGRQVDHGFFCLGCMDETGETGETDETDEETMHMHFRIKYTTGEMSEHIASCGRVEGRPGFPGEFMHITKDYITP